MIDWKREIAIAHLVKRKLAEVDSGDLWAHHFPEVGAAEETIRSAEHALGFSLDAEHRAFLGHADGWKAFVQDFDVFGVADLLGGPRHQRALEMLGSLEDLKSLCGFERSELLPLALSAANIDLFAITRPDSACPGLVLWLAGGVIDRFPSFSEWFLAMVDYNRREFQRMTGQLQ